MINNRSTFANQNLGGDSEKETEIRESPDFMNFFSTFESSAMGSSVPEDLLMPTLESIASSPSPPPPSMGTGTAFSPDIDTRTGLRNIEEKEPVPGGRFAFAAKSMRVGAFKKSQHVNSRAAPFGTRQGIPCRPVSTAGSDQSASHPHSQPRPRGWSGMRSRSTTAESKPRPRGWSGIRSRTSTEESKPRPRGYSGARVRSNTEPPAATIVPKCTPSGVVKEEVICKNYLWRCCKRGRDCKYIHDPSVWVPDSQKVFLGGFPRFMINLDADQIVAEFKAIGYTIINRPIMHEKGFIFKATLNSVGEAQRMVKEKFVNLDPEVIYNQCEMVRQIKISVRPYTEKYCHKSLKFSGIPPSMTSDELHDGLLGKGFLVESVAPVENGAAQTEMETVDAADALAILESVKINGTEVFCTPIIGNKSEEKFWRNRKNCSRTRGRSRPETADRSPNLRNMNQSRNGSRTLPLPQAASRFAKPTRPPSLRVHRAGSSPPRPFGFRRTGTAEKRLALPKGAGSSLFSNRAGPKPTSFRNRSSTF